MDDYKNASYEDRIYEIRSIMKYNQDYYICILQYKNVLKKIKGTKEEFDNLINWICNYDIALCYKKIGDIDKAIKYANTAMLYDVPEVKRVQNLWLLAVCYEQKQMIKEAIEIYLACSRCYKKAYLNRLRACVLFNICKIKKRPDLLFKIINFVENDNDYTYNDMMQTEVGKYQILKSMYQEMVDFCLQNNYSYYIFRILRNIKDKQLKNEIKEYIYKV